MWNAKIQYNLSVCQSASWIQLKSLDLARLPLCVRRSMPDSGFCRTIPTHLSTLPPRTVCKEHPINYRDHTDIIELFSPAPALITSHLLLKIDSSCTVAPSGYCSYSPEVLWFLFMIVTHIIYSSWAQDVSDFKFGSHMAPSLPPFCKCNRKGRAVREVIQTCTGDGNSFQSGVIFLLKVT